MSVTKQRVARQRKYSLDEDRASCGDRKKQKINLQSHNSSFLLKCQPLASKAVPTFLERINIRTE